MSINYTPEEITEILNDYFSGITHKQYIGARYVPIFGRKDEDSILWDNTAPYEPLTIVLYQGNSYTSRQYVPIGIDISDDRYWVITGNYNAQVEQYRRDVLRIGDMLPQSEFSSTDTVKDYIDENTFHHFDSVADMQAASNLEAGMVVYTSGFDTSGDGGAAFYEISSSGDIEVGDNLFATRVNAGATPINLEQLANVGNGIYTLGTVTVDDPVLLSGIQHRGIIIVDTVFNINTPVLFPRTGNSSYWTLPSFVGCTFKNMTDDRVLVASGETNMVGSRIAGCNFVNVDMVSGTYVQDFDFTSCYIQSCQTFLECLNSTVQARFVNCSVESESKKLVTAKRAVVYVNGVIEGNESADYYFFDFVYGLMELDGAWLEGTKFAKITGSTNQSEKTTIVITGSTIVASVEPMFDFTNTDYVYMYIFGSQWNPHDSNSRLCTNAPSDFGSLIGSFHNLSSDTYNYPFGGVSALDCEIATKQYVADASSVKQYIGAHLSNTPISVVLPCGMWRVTIARYISSTNTLVEYEYLVFAQLPYSTDTSVLKAQTIPTTDTYLESLTITATKATTADTTFTLEISATMNASYNVSISKA